MRNNYVFIFTLFIFSTLTFQIFSQDINDIGKSVVDQMKLDGKLTGKEIFTDRTAIRVDSKVSDVPTQKSINSCDCWIPRDNGFQIAQFNGSGMSGGPGLPPEYRNDDWTTFQLNLPFNLCFYGQQVDSLFINNNGNVSIRNPYSTFSGVSFPDTFIMIAPFWADVDTRGAGSGLVYYKITPTHMIIQWEQVGYYSNHDDKLNTFQLILTDGNDPIISQGHNVSFCYKDMQWTTGDASQGTGGFGGIPATVGVNRGNGVDYLQFGLFDAAGTNYDGAYGLNDGVDWLDNQSFNINACINSANIPPVLNSLNVCDTIRLCENTTYQLTANYLSPEPNETTNINFFAGGMTGVTVLSNTPGNTATLELEIIGQASNIGYHTISVTAIDNGTPPAATNSNFVVEIMPAPLPSFTYSPASPISTNTTVSFTNTTPPGSLLTWNFGDNSPTSTAPNPTHTYTTAGTYTATLTAMFPNGCTTSISQQIVVTSCSPATFTVSDACVNAPSLVIFTGSASPTALFNWDFNGGNVINGSGNGPYTVSWPTAGQISVTLTVIESNCSSTVSMPVNIHDIPVASITSLAPLCAGDSPVISFNGTAGPTATFNWNFGTGTIISGSGAGPYTVQWNNPANDFITLFVDDNGCGDTAQIAVLVNPVPTADFNMQSAACANEQVQISYLGNATAAANYTWNFNGATIISGSGQGPYNVSWNSGGSFNTELVVTENGCSSQPFTLPMTITDVPVVTISQPAPICEGQTADVNFTGTAGAGAVYNWNFGNATVISGSGAGPYTLQLNTTGNNQVQLSVDENGCSAQASVGIMVHAIPTSDFLINNAACIDAPVNISYSGTTGPGATYTWTFNNGTVISGTGGGPYNVSWSAQGVYNISLVVTENGCVSTQTDLPATVNPLPVVFAGNDQTECSGTAISIGTVPVAGFTYQWTPSTGLSDPSIADPVVIAVNNTNATRFDDYILRVTDVNGCVNQDTIRIGSFPVPLVFYDTPPGQCFKDNLFDFSASANIPTGVNFVWTFSPEANILTTTQADVTVFYTSTGKFPVTLAADYNGCIAVPKIDSIEVFPMPTSEFTTLVTSGCEPLEVPFTNLSIGDVNNYTWNFHDGTNDNAQDPLHIFQDAGLYDVSLLAVNKFGCETDTTYADLINVYPTPEGQFIPNPQVANILAPVIQFQNYSTNAQIYAWDFGDSDTSMQWSPSHEYRDTGNYIVTLALISPNGCIDTVQGAVRVEDNFSFFIPNSFTPNNDGVNDYFRGYGVAIKQFTMNIYNRWGELIFTSNNYDLPWDGKTKSGAVMADTYVYRIALVDHHNELHTYYGDVSVVR